LEAQLSEVNAWLAPFSAFEPDVRVLDALEARWDRESLSPRELKKLLREKNRFHRTTARVIGGSAEELLQAHADKAKLREQRAKIRSLNQRKNQMKASSPQLFDQLQAVQNAKTDLLKKTRELKELVNKALKEKEEMIAAFKASNEIYTRSCEEIHTVIRLAEER
jgi:uncharacterized membrane protein YgaE (UPF0421/DUF939 family)